MVVLENKRVPGILGSYDIAGRSSAGGAWAVVTDCHPAVVNDQVAFSGRGSGPTDWPPKRRTPPTEGSSSAVAFVVGASQSDDGNAVHPPEPKVQVAPGSAELTSTTSPRAGSNAIVGYRSAGGAVRRWLVRSVHANPPNAHVPL